MGRTQSIEQAKRYIDLGEITAAEEITERLREKGRGSVEVQFLEGCIRYKRGDYAAAVDLFRQVIEQSPDDINARVNLGVALVDAGLPAAAITHLQQVVGRRPDHFVAWYNLGNAYRTLERFPDARQAYLRAIAGKPGYYPAHNNLGAVLNKLGLWEDAARSYRKVIELNPAPDSYINLLHLLKRRDLGRTHALMHEAVQRFADLELFACVFPSAVNLCDWPLIERIRGHVVEYAQSADIKPGVLQDLLLPLNSCPDIAGDTQLAIHRNWARRIGGVAMTGDKNAITAPAAGKLCVAYLSGDFSGHAVGLFMRHLFASHDRNRFEIVCYSTSGQKDDFTREMERRVDVFADVSALDDAALAHRIRQDGIDLLIDLGGHTLNNRVAALRYRPAPVQLTYLGYPNTTGLAEVDYRITDRYAEAEDGTRYTERLVAMPESFLCFGAFAERPRATEPPVVAKGYVTFGSFNHTRKLTPDAVRLWSEILRQVPGSRLLIKASLAGEACVQENLYEAFAAQGIGRERVELRGFTETRDSHLDCYNEVDIALDTFPYNGTTTTCEALWMGVPVVTLVGRVHAQRVTYSILKNIGVEETIAWTEAEYVAIAVGLAQDLEVLKGLRSKIPGSIRGSILCDPVRFTRQLEELFNKVWQEKGFSLSAADGKPAAAAANCSAPVSVVDMLGQARILLIGERAAEAGVLAERVLEQDPDNINALFVAGTACYKSGDYDRGIELLSRAVEIAPDFIDAHLNLGAACNEAGHHARAEAQYLAVLAMDPRHHIAHNNLGKLYHGQLRLDEAYRALETSIRISANYWVAWFNLGSVCSAQGDYDAAARKYRRSLEIEHHPEVCAALISVLKKTGHYQEAYRLAGEFVERMEAPVDSLLPVATVFYESCAWQVLDCLQPTMLEIAADGATRNAYLSNILLDLNTRSDIEHRQLFELHRLWGEKARRHAHAFDDYPVALCNDERLRIGYLSPDFRSHAVGLFIDAIVAAHDTARFEIFCYSKSPALDTLSERIAAKAQRFVDVSALADDAIAQQIHADGIHILIDLAGHTAETGMPTLRYRPAPVQLTYLGYPNTTGLAEVDYRITDRYAEAEDGTRYTERLVAMPESFLCFGAFAERPRATEPPVVAKGYVTFGSFNHTRKLTPDAVRLWSEILRQVPGSRLLIKASLAGEACVQENLYEAFAAQGIGRERVELRGFTETRDSHLDCYNEVDIALDTFPYNGTTTTCEALWMGVPVVTLVGRVHAQRVTYSILKNIGVEETIAWTEAEYVAIAVGLAQDLEVLKGLRSKIPGSIRGSILCDPVRFTRQIEQLYAGLWRDKSRTLLQGIKPTRPGRWVDHVQDKPYVSALLSSWLEYMEEKAGTERWLSHQQAIDLYFEAQTEDITVRREKLMYARQILTQSLRSKPGLSVAQTFLRVAVELGETERALAVAHELAQQIMTQDSVELSGPFLPALAGYEQVAIHGEPKWWVLAALLELHDRLLSGGTGYPDHEAAKVLDLIAGLGYGNAYVEDRHCALKAQSHVDPDLQLEEPRSDKTENVTPFFIAAPHCDRLPYERPIRILHNLGRSGGTLISRCLACMQDIVLLSEIHPKGSERFSPLAQAQSWFQLFDEHELQQIQSSGRVNFLRQLDLIEQRCHDLGKNLVVRDWAHLDFHAVPFSSRPSYEFTTANVLEFSGLFRISSLALTRHPIDQWNSLSRLAFMHDQLGLADFLRGYRHYAEQCVRAGFVRYEDFVAHPEDTMKRLCGYFELAYDGDFINNWPDYNSITGDISTGPVMREIKMVPRRGITSAQLDRFANNEDYRVTLDLLGYRHPQ